MPTLIDHVRRHVAACCSAAGVDCPTFTDAQIRRVLREEFNPNEPRDPGGKWTKGGGGGKKAGKTKRQYVATPKKVARLNRFTSAARRRMVLHGLRNEAELANALNAHNLPDSEPADVVHAVTEDGEVLQDHEKVKFFLRMREYMVQYRDQLQAKKNRSESDNKELARAERSLQGTLILFEVKTLHTQKGEGHIRMSASAIRRKKRWEKRYGAKFATVAFDDRRGGKHSGHRLYFKAGIGNMRIADMQKASDFNDLLDKVSQ